MKCDGYVYTKNIKQKTCWRPAVCTVVKLGRYFCQSHAENIAMSGYKLEPLMAKKRLEEEMGQCSMFLSGNPINVNQLTRGRK